MTAREKELRSIERALEIIRLHHMTDDEGNSCECESLAECHNTVTEHLEFALDAARAALALPSEPRTLTGEEMQERVVRFLANWPDREPVDPVVLASAIRALPLSRPPDEGER